MINKIPEFEDEFWRRRKQEALIFTSNFTNILALICKIIEILSLGTLAFRP